GSRLILCGKEYDLSPVLTFPVPGHYPRARATIGGEVIECSAGRVNTDGPSQVAVHHPAIKRLVFGLVFQACTVETVPGQSKGRECHAACSGMKRKPLVGRP